MTVAVDVVDETRLLREREAVARLVQAVLEREGLAGEVVVAFVDEARMVDLNARYRGVASPTDVLTFVDAAEGSWPATGTEGTAGEIVVCPRVVVRYAGEEERDPAVQLGWTLVHGALHLAGYDHETDRGEMRERERDVLRDLQPLVHLLSVASEPG